MTEDRAKRVLHRLQHNPYIGSLCHAPPVRILGSLSQASAVRLAMPFPSPSLTQATLTRHRLLTPEETEVDEDRPFSGPVAHEMTSDQLRHCPSTGFVLHDTPHQHPGHPEPQTQPEPEPQIQPEPPTPPEPEPQTQLEPQTPPEPQTGVREATEPVLRSPLPYRVIPNYFGESRESKLHDDWELV